MQTKDAIIGPHGSTAAKKLSPEQRKPAPEGIKATKVQIARDPAVRRKLSKALVWRG